MAPVDRVEFKDDPRAVYECRTTVCTEEPTQPNQRTSVLGGLSVVCLCRVLCAVCWAGGMVWYGPVVKAL